MKILQVNKFYYPIVGGIESVVKDIANGLNEKGFEIKTLVCNKGSFRLVESINGVQVYRAASLGTIKSMPISLDFFKLFKALAKDADIIILHHPFPLGFLAYNLFGNGKKLVVWYHSDIVRQKFLHRLILPIIKKTLFSSNLILVSGKNIIQNSKILQSFKSKCAVIPFGIREEKYKLSEEIKKQADLIKKRFKDLPIILSVGRLVYYKGFDVLIAAMRNLNAILLIIGKGPLKDSLSELARSLGLEQRVKFIDTVPDLVPYYHACDIFVLASTEPSEAFGIVQLEAMVCSKPVINTRLQTAVPEVSIDGQTGFTVAAGNADLLTEAITKLLKDSDLKIRLGKQAKDRIATFFTFERFIDSLIGNLKAL